MRIAFLAGADSVPMYCWARELQDRGHEVIFLSESRSPHPIGVPLELLQFRLKDNYIKFWINRSPVERILHDFQADVLHAFYTTNYGVLAARQRVCPAIITIAGSDILVEPRRSRFFRWVNQYVLRKVRLINPVSMHLDKILKVEYNVQHKSEVFSVGVDGRIFFQSEDRPEKPLRVISTRHFKPIYNQQLLVAAIPKVLREYSCIRFIIFGDGPERENFREQLSSYSQVQCFGRRPWEELSEQLRKSHIYISTSLSDGASASLLEAMACGAFPIVTDIPANREWIEDGKNGFLVPVDNPEILSQRILTAMHETNLRRNAEKINQELIMERANLQNIVSRLEELYQRILTSA
jgi:glycosyltransferase involved in cell wall biosynthesis